MYWQPYLLRRSDSADFGSTYRIDLPKSGVVGSIFLNISADQVSNAFINGGAERIVDYIDKVEIIGNGATIIKSLTGQQIQALAFYDQGIVSPDVIRTYASNTQMCRLLLNFGRWFGDPDLGLDLSKWDNVELRITNSASTTYFQTEFSVTTILFQQRPSAQARSLGYLKTEIWRSWTSVKDAWEYLELPTEGIIRRILLQAIPAYDSTSYAADTGFTNVLYDIQHYLLTGEQEVFVGRASDLALLNLFYYGREVLAHLHPYVNADKALRTGVGYPLAHVFTPASYSGSAESLVTTLTAGQTADTLLFEQGAGAGPDEGLIKGYGYHNTLLLNHDWDQDPNTWLNPQSMKQVLLNLHTRNSDTADNGTISVVLDRLVRM